jgi:hypothetical protein
MTTLGSVALIVGLIADALYIVVTVPDYWGDSTGSRRRRAVISALRRGLWVIAPMGMALTLVGVNLSTVSSVRGVYDYPGYTERAFALAPGGINRFDTKRTGCDAAVCRLDFLRRIVAENGDCGTDVPVVDQSWFGCARAQFPRGGPASYTVLCCKESWW